MGELLTTTMVGYNGQVIANEKLPRAVFFLAFNAKVAGKTIQTEQPARDAYTTNENNNNKEREREEARKFKHI